MRRLAGVLLAVSVLGCGPNASEGPGGGDGDGDGDSDLDAAVNCGAQEEEIRLINNGPPPDLLIVMDRSGSMSSPPPSFPPTFTPKWTIMKNALQTVLTEYDQNIKLGLSLFPNPPPPPDGDQVCGVEPGVAVDIQLGHSGQVLGALEANAPGDGGTPAQFGLAEARAYYATIPVNPDGRYVLFATDGAPNCTMGDANDETVAAVEGLLDDGIKTIVLGFGGGFFGDFGTVLNDAAQAGGAKKPGGPPHYYAANNADELEDALLDIAGGIIKPSCEFRLTSRPPDPNLVRVTLDGVAIPRDPGHNNGWDYHPNMSTITIFGDYCDDVESGAVSNVSFTYGCPGPVVE